MEADLPVDARLTVPGEELKVSTSRSGGPGGQHVNTTESRVTLRWNIRTSRALDEDARAFLLEKLGARVSAEGEVSVSVSDERSQLTNREIARERLAASLRAARFVPRPRRPTRPGRGATERRLQEKRERSERRQSRTQRGDEG